MERQLGKVDGVHVGFEDHGIFTIYVYLAFGGMHQGFGGYALDEWSKKRDRRVGTAAGMDMLLQLTKLFDVTALHKAKGSYVYALREDDAWNSPIIGLQRVEADGGAKFLVSDWKAQWFPETEKSK